MKLDGEKLLAELLAEYDDIDKNHDTSNIFIRAGIRRGFLDCIKTIQSGDYTIEDKG